MPDELKARQGVAKADRAKLFLNSAEWQEAWDTYRDRIMSEFEKAKSDETDKIMQLKRLLTAATAAKTHLETLIVDGRVASADLQLFEKKGILTAFRR